MPRTLEVRGIFFKDVAELVLVAEGLKNIKNHM